MVHEATDQPTGRERANYGPAGVLPHFLARSVGPVASLIYGLVHGLTAFVGRAVRDVRCLACGTMRLIGRLILE
jgi:hypothetical protein